MPSEDSLRQRLKKKATKPVVSTSRNSIRTKKNENSFEKNGVCDRGNGSEGKLKKRVKVKGMQCGGEVEERGKLRTLDSGGKKKRVYAKEGWDKNVKLENGVETSKKKRTLIRNGEKRVKDEPVEGNTGHLTMRGPSKSMNAGLKVKQSTHMRKERKEDVVLVTDKQKGKAKEVGKIGLVGAEDQGSRSVKRGRENKTELSKGKNQVVVSRSSFAKKKARDKTGLDDDDAEMLDDRPKKKKRVIKIDPHDISNKRLDDGIGINGSKEEKKNEKESEKEPKMSKNAQFRAIQPSPLILSFVEKNVISFGKETHD
uniref:Uncharacterized protein n=1 Tax=Glycine max TaxID=3847 RepID=A0A0R0EX82_SOYBN